MFNALVRIVFASSLAGLVEKPDSSRFHVGRLSAQAICESSGLVASRQHAGVFWTMNDSGNPPVLYAVKESGDLIREFPVDAKNVDWEDLAIDDEGQIYIGDMGNNTLKRDEVIVYKVKEPDPSKPPDGKLRIKASWRLRYPEKPFDCESLFVLKGKAYVLAKRLNGSVAQVYSFDLKQTNHPITLQHVTDIPSIRAPVTAADVSADGKRLAILTLLGPYILEIDGDVTRLANAPARYSRFLSPNMEAACFVPEGLLVTTESRDVLLFRERDFR